MTPNSVSYQIKKLRRQKQMTLQELADLCDLTKGYLSKIENSAKVPPYETLNRIARVLGVAISELMPDEAGDQGAGRFGICLTPASEYEAVIRDEGDPQHKEALIADSMTSKNMAPFVREIGHDIVPMQKFKGEIMIHVLEGSIQLVVGDESFVMYKDDNIYFDADIHHAAVTREQSRSRLLIVRYYYRRSP